MATTEQKWRTETVKLSEEAERYNFMNEKLSQYNYNKMALEHFWVGVRIYVRQRLSCCVTE